MRLRRCGVVFMAALLVTFALPPTPVRAASGDLDPTFADGGVAVTDLTSGPDEGRAVASDSHGRLYVASKSWSGTSYKMRLTVLDEDGENVIGMGSASFDGGLAIPSAIATVESESGEWTDVYVAGSSFNGESYDIALWQLRLYTGGDAISPLDLTSYIPETYRIGSGNAHAESVAVQDDGKLVLAGSALSGAGDFEFAVLRVDPTSRRLDPTFSDDGWTMTSIGSADSWAEGVAIQPDGKIIAVGTAQDGDDNVVAAARFTQDGTLDAGFADDGTVTTAVGSGGRGTDVVVDGRGNIVVGGYAKMSSTNTDFLALRYRPDGVLDRFFSRDGKATVSLTNRDDYASSVAVSSSGVTLAGTAGWTDTGIIRLNSRGSLDSTFAGDGKLVHSLSAVQEYIFDAVLGVDNAVVVVGQVTGDTAVARFTREGDVDAGFAAGGSDGVGGLAVYDISGESGEHHGVSVLPDGKILTLGPSLGQCVGCIDELSAYRYDTSGTLDPTFGVGGVVSVSLSAMVQDVVSTRTTAAAANESGRMVISGSVRSSTDDYSIVFAALRADGSLDSSFDSDGVAVLPAWDVYDYEPTLAVDTQGRVLLAFNLDDPTPPDDLPNGAYVLRMTASGQLDTTFGDGGMVRVEGQIGDLGLQPSTGRILASLHASGCASDSHMPCSWVTSLTADGQVDVEYGEDGKTVLVEGPGYGISQTNIDVATTGRAVVVSAGQTSVLAMLTPSGDLDGTFGDGGLVIDYDSVEQPGNVAFAPNGDVVAVDGRVIFRYTPQGEPDPTFGEGGRATLPYPLTGSMVYEESVDVTADGRPVIASAMYTHCWFEGDWYGQPYTWCFKYEPAVARLQP